MNTRYPAIQIFFHWLSLIFIALTYLTVNLKGIGHSDGWRNLMMNCHFTLGILVFFTVIFRLILRHLYLKQIPEINPAPPTGQTKSAHYVHLSLYLIFIILPILGTLIVLNKGVALPFFGFPIIDGFNADKALSHTIKEIHETVANLGLAIIALHAAAALYHHYLLKDNTLIRMMPRKSKCATKKLDEQ